MLAVVLAPAPETMAGDFDDFRIPTHRLTDWRVTFDAFADRYHSAPPGSDYGLRTASARTGSSYGWLSDSDPAFTSVGLEGIAQGGGSWNTQDLTGAMTRDASATERRFAAERWRASLRHRRYPSRVPLGLSLSADAAGFYDQTWEYDHDASLLDDGVNRTEITSRARSQEWRYSTFVGLHAMVGWGRVRDATGVYDALILEERLLESGAIVRTLSGDARRRLAALMYVRLDYSIVHERPAKEFWAEVASILRADGALREGGLEADAVPRSGEVHLGQGITPDVLPRSALSRLVGYFVGPWLSVQSSQNLLRLDGGNYSQRIVNGVPDPPFTSESRLRLRSTTDEVLGGVTGEYHRALGPRWQVDVTGRVAAQLRSRDEGFEGGASVRGYWMVSDRWLIGAAGSYNRAVKRRADDGVTTEDTWTTALSTEVTWFVEDRLLLRMSLWEIQARGHGAFPLIAREGRVQLGLTYRLRGTFQAPDLGLGRLPG
jgi:hypothetical protein